MLSCPRCETGALAGPSGAQRAPGESSPPIGQPNLACYETAAALLRDLPALLQEAPAPERRAILAQCIDKVLLDRRTVVAIHAKPLIAPALIAANERLSDAEWHQKCAWWAGWAPGTRSDTPYTLLHPRRVAA